MDAEREKQIEKAARIALLIEIAARRGVARRDDGLEEMDDERIGLASSNGPTEA